MTWITDLEITSSTIDFTVEANSETSSRTATLTVSYPGAADVSLTVVQEIQYDYNHDLSVFLGYHYSQEGESEEDMFYIWLSDLEFSDDGYTQAGGHYYNFYLFVSETDGKSLPNGTYTYTTSYGGDMTFASMSRYLIQNDSDYDEVYLTGGSITVSADGNTYTIEGSVTDEDGKVHRISYTGSAEVHSFVLEDVEFTATTAVANCYESYGSFMNVELMFTNMPYDNGSVIPPGTVLYLDTYMPYDATGKITPGTYTVNYAYESMIIYPEIMSYAVNYTSTSYSNHTYGNINSGTMTIEERSSDYYITCDLTTSDGASVKCTYEGTLGLENMPYPTSTLSGDITVNIGSDVSAKAYSYDDLYSNGGKNWVVQLVPSGGGEGIDIDLNANYGSTDDGIPSGTYYAATASSGRPGIGEYYAGYLFFSFPYGTWYYELDEYDNYLNIAPALSGGITFTNNGNGSYKIEFACTDDAGYVWSGEWEGTIIHIDYFSTLAISSSQHSANFKLKTQEIRPKVMETKIAQRESMLKVSVSSNKSRTDAVSKFLK